MKYGFQVEEKREGISCYNQVHGKTLIEIKDPAHSERLKKEKPKADGAYTFHPEVELSVFTADCLPILFYSSNPKAPIGVVHSGWRGALQGIAKEMVKIFASYPGQTRAIFGPCILSCCFEVKADFVEAFSKVGTDVNAYLEKRSGKMFFDLPKFVRETQMRGIEIDTTTLRCTHCSEPRLPSYRRDGGRNPRIRGWINSR